MRTNNREQAELLERLKALKLNFYPVAEVEFDEVIDGIQANFEKNYLNLTKCCKAEVEVCASDTDRWIECSECHKKCEPSEVYNDICRYIAPLEVLAEEDVIGSLKLIQSYIKFLSSHWQDNRNLTSFLRCIHVQLHNEIARLELEEDSDD